MKKILLTGISGFIGRHVAQHLLSCGYQITALIRPGTDEERIASFKGKVSLQEVNLSDGASLQTFLANRRFDAILHIGALRGGRKFSNDEYARVNIKATEILCENAWQNKSRFLFCSSVGIFGAIPVELPANEKTPRQKDNFYHYTKIEAERIVRDYVRKGMQAAILRPSITYGRGDYGFPYTLTRLVDKKLMLLPNREVRIHLTNIRTLANAFNKLLEIDFSPGAAYIIADQQPVGLTELADFIGEQLKDFPTAGSTKLPGFVFDSATAFFKMLKNELWVSRLQLISKSWYYNTESSVDELNLQLLPTIPEFKIVTDWYKEIN